MAGIIGTNISDNIFTNLWNGFALAGGLLMGINNILTAPGIFYDEQSLIDVHNQFKGLADMINIFANAPFTLLPILIGFSGIIICIHQVRMH